MSTICGPLSPEWLAPFPSAQGEAGLCRDTDGKLWLCVLVDEAEGWKKIKSAGKVDVYALQWCQRMSGRPAQPDPEGMAELSGQ